jgi:hypothetical protein|tara:strand:- start:325 stop:642 length:318 start_codon:yes stop_codon:yes gene_type:complete
MGPTQKRYRLEKVIDLRNIPEDRRQICYRELDEVFRQLTEAEDKHRRQLQSGNVIQRFRARMGIRATLDRPLIWTDDGLNTVTSTDLDTGEVTSRTYTEVCHGDG